MLYRDSQKNKTISLANQNFSKLFDTTVCLIIEISDSDVMTYLTT